MNKLALHSIVLLLLLPANVISQSTETSDSKVKFGAGFDFELFDFDYYPYFIAPNIKLSIEIADAIRIEPGFGYRKGKTERVHTEYTSDYKKNQLGLGVYWVSRNRTVTPVLGLYLDYAKSLNQSADSDSFSSEEGNEFRIGPSLWIEYIISEHFSIGGDLLFLKSKTERIYESDYNDHEYKTTGFSTGSNLRLRFFF